LDHAGQSHTVEREPLFSEIDTVYFLDPFTVANKASELSQSRSRSLPALK